MNGSVEITSDMVNDMEFIMNFSKTLEAVNKLSTCDKVKYFGNLLRNSYLIEEKTENDIFEEYLRNLVDISYRELKYLLFLKENPIKNNSDKEWIAFKELFCKEFGGNRVEVYNRYLRLKRTGFINEEYYLESKSVSKDSVGDYELDYSSIDSNGFSVTAFFDDFCKKILDNIKDC